MGAVFMRGSSSFLFFLVVSTLLLACSFSALIRSRRTDAGAIAVVLRDEATGEGFLQNRLPKRIGLK